MIEEVLNKLKIARSEKGYSHDNMAHGLGISQASYTNIEKNNSKITVERLIKIAEILDKHICYFFESDSTVKINGYNQLSKFENVVALYQQVIDTNVQLTKNYELTIQIMKDDLAFLRQIIADK